MAVYFVRHGQTDANIQYDAYPWNTDCPLNETGVQQVHKTADFLAETRGDDAVRVIASPLVRAQQTAQIIANRLGCLVETHQDLRELQVGDWQQRDIATVYAFFMGLPPEKRFTFVPPHGESWQTCGQRVAAVAGTQPGTVIIVSHSAPIQSAIGTMLDVTFTEWAAYQIRNASVSLLTNSGGHWRASYVGRVLDPSAKVGLF